MGDVIYLSEENAFTMNMLKKTISAMSKKNTNGKYDDAIQKDTAVLRSFFDEVLGRSEAVEREAAA